MEDLSVFTEQICFNQNDFDNGKLLPFAVLKKFQHIATSHANALKIGCDEMIKQNLLWITMRIKFQVLSNITPNEQLFITTIPQAKNVLEFDRDFIIQNSLGKRLVIGTSKWCLIDKTTRRLAKLSNVDYPIQLQNKPLFEGKFLKTETFEPVTDPALIYQVKPSDIDYNGHLNNTIYSKLVTDSLPNNLGQLGLFQINFLSEALLDDKILVFTKQNDNAYTLVGKFTNDKLCFSAFVTFED